MKILSAEKEYIVPFDKRPTDSAHASTLLPVKKDSLLAAWFGGSWEKDCNVSIWMSKRDENGVWDYPYVAADVRNIALWNPVLFRCPDNSILLFYKVGAKIEHWETYAIRSTDEGDSWSEPFELVEGDGIGGRGPVKNKPILLSDGMTILAPASLEGESWDCFADISRDNGETWEMSSMVPVRHSGYNIQMVDQPYEKHRCWGKGIIQPTLWEDCDGDIHMLCRSTSSALFRSDSHDKGATWCTAYDSGLPNNNSGIDLVRMPDGTLVLAYNPVNNLPNYYKGPRTPLVLDYSEDNGLTWKSLKVLEDGPGDYAYPSIVCRNNHLLEVCYTQKREQICYWRISLER